MTELSGTLEGVGLSAIIRFLGGLKKSGCLRIAEHGWQGEIFFDEGQVRDARLGSRSGLAVLDVLAETLPRARFTFDSQALLLGEPSIRLSPEALQAHLDELSARVANGRSSLPRPDAVLVHRTEEEGHGEPLSLDRATLQTLLAIDGKRDVREVVARRGSFDALWQIGTLVDAGLVELRTTSDSAADFIAEQMPVRPIAAEPGAARPALAEPLVARMAPTPSSEPAPTASEAHCPQLGFEDDCTNSFERPTRLHRCFAAGAPMPLSLDQQRELCLSDHFRTCPRLNTVELALPAAVESNRPGPFGAEPHTVTATVAEEPDDSRIVHIPFGTRAASSPAREPLAASPAVPTPLRANGVTSSQQIFGERQRPLRARIEQTLSVQASAATSAPTPTVALAEAADAVMPELESATPVYIELPTQVHARAAAPAQPRTRVERPNPIRRIGAIAGAVLALAAVGAVVYPFTGQLRGLAADDSVDPSPANTSRVATGTPVGAPTTVASNPAAAAADPAAQAGPAPTVSPAQPLNTQPQSSKTLFDEHFTTNSANWPSSPRGTASLVNGTYRIAPQQVGQFVAIGAPITDLPADTVVSATFHKVAGPPGGGYGIIVRDQSPSTRDGTSQDGRYYVLEVGDKGEVGIWRREVDHWVNLLAWLPSDTVKPGTATNEITARAIGNTLTLLVNGVQAASLSDDALSSGGVGLFVGGDGNQVEVDHFSIQTP